jgi:hypothetical protein
MSISRMAGPGWGIVQGKAGNRFYGAKWRVKFGGLVMSAGRMKSPLTDG